MLSLSLRASSRLRLLHSWCLLLVGMAALPAPLSADASTPASVMVPPASRSRPLLATTPRRFSRGESPFATISHLFLATPVDSGRLLVRKARSQLGATYTWGAQLPGLAFDCSGFVQWVTASLRLRLPRVSQAQALAGVPVPMDSARLRPGDLLTFGRHGVVTHVGLYVGHGRYIHASSEAGRVIESALPDTTRRPGWWQGARRLVGPVPDDAQTLQDALRRLHSSRRAS